ncbi:hypothetical protein AA0118_g9235 [Alternaria tenuissima]|nr:hypothetical protein AA0118_g9235 [Alternaria tenuissima]
MPGRVKILKVVQTVRLPPKDVAATVADISGVTRRSKDVVERGDLSNAEAPANPKRRSPDEVPNRSERVRMAVETKRFTPPT